MESKKPNQNQIKCRQKIVKWQQQNGGSGGKAPMSALFELGRDTFECGAVGVVNMTLCVW